MNRIDQLFQHKKKDILSIYYPAGFPNLNDTIPTLKVLQRKGVDMVEIGIPFSDPLADGPVIQAASKKALDNGMNLKLLFEQLKNIREIISIPVILMGYWNPVFKYGIEKFLHDCQSCGIDGVILPDLPMEEYLNKHQNLFGKFNIHNILLVTPQTNEKRLSTIANVSKGFLYMISTSSTTGGSLEYNKEKEEYFKRIARLDIPSMTGFGIHDHESFKYACKYANGAIIGTAFIKALEKGDVESFIDTILSKI